MNKPHVIKFSGGRSSGMMLMELLKNNKLKIVSYNICALPYYINIMGNPNNVFPFTLKIFFIRGHENLTAFTLASF